MVPIEEGVSQSPFPNNKTWRIGTKFPVFNKKTEKLCMMHEKDTSCYSSGVRGINFSEKEITLTFTNGLKPHT